MKLMKRKRDNLAIRFRQRRTRPLFIKTDNSFSLGESHKSGHRECLRYLTLEIVSLKTEFALDVHSPLVKPNMEKSTYLPERGA